MNISKSSDEVHKEPHPCGAIAVLAGECREHSRELLGDARQLADRLETDVVVLHCVDATAPAEDPSDWFQRGADQVVVVPLDLSSLPANSTYCSLMTRLDAIERWYRVARPRILFVPASGSHRSLAARLAVRCEVEFYFPTLLARVEHGRLQVSTLHGDGKRARQSELAEDVAAILVMNPQVAQARRPDPSRQGTVITLPGVKAESEAISQARHLEADPAVANIEHLPRLVAGGYGLGGREGFQLLQEIAAQLSAGVAASRMAVDCGWIDRERQVGQTGKTVRPELYLACGISGASHHLEGMSQSRHILALNTDPQAPIFRVAHLGLVADWQQTLLKFRSMLPGPSAE